MHMYIHLSVYMYLDICIYIYIYIYATYKTRMFQKMTLFSSSELFFNGNVEQIGTARVVSLTEIRMGLSFRIYHTFGGASQNQHRCLRSANAQITTMIAA